MKRPQATVLLVSRQRVGRWDLPNEGAAPMFAVRQPGSTLPEAVAEALALGGLPGPIWIFSDELFMDDVTLSPAQVAGLTSDQLARALAFEIEPFSGISLADAALGYREKGRGLYAVVEASAADREEIRRLLAPTGGKLMGLAPLTATGDDAAACADLIRQAQAGLIPVIRPATATPWKHRRMAVGLGVWLAVVTGLIGWRVWQGVVKTAATLATQRHAQLTADLQNQVRLADQIRTELAALEKQDGSRRELIARRMALAAALRALATLRPDDIVIRSIAPEGPSSLVIGGFSVDAGAADEMSVVLSEKLKSAGWSALPRQKTRLGPPSGSGGAWEFSLLLTHDEATRGPTGILSQRDPE